MNHASQQELTQLLDEAYERYAQPRFIVDDPVQIPRSYRVRGDIEVMGFLTATIAWGQRTTIIHNAQRLGRLMGDEPHAFVMGASDQELEHLSSFVHRTFNGADLRYFVMSLRNLYEHHGSLEHAFSSGRDPMDMATMISGFRTRFFSLPHPLRTTKHVADPLRGSSAKRINMFLRWMVRHCDRGIDLGIWNIINSAHLRVPLDVHTGNVARELGLLHRKQNDWKAVEELTDQLRELDPTDPVKYDIALFGLGVYDGKPIS